MAGSSMTDHAPHVDTPTGEGTVEVTGGVDTHKDFHVAAAKDGLGRLLNTATFPASTTGFTALLAWLHTFGTVIAVGVEGTSSYGAGLARHLHAAGITVVEVNRPDRAKRRRNGKSDTHDAISAAAAVQSGDAHTVPKAGTGIAAAVRVLRTVRASAVKSRTVALNQLDSLLVTAPAALREHLAHLTATARITACARLRPDHDLADPSTATKTALRRLARRVQVLTTEIDDADTELAPLLTVALPRTMALLGVGPETAGQLLCTTGDNPERITTESGFAHLCGTAPIEASSGYNNDCWRLNRGGDRHANAALYRIVIVRMRHCPKTRAYVAKRTTDGKSKRAIIRCLKRYVTREIYRTLTADLATTQAT
jgi:transposase